jgi:hypothetical protein
LPLEDVNFELAADFLNKKVDRFFETLTSWLAEVNGAVLLKKYKNIFGALLEALGN